MSGPEFIPSPPVLKKGRKEYFFINPQASFTNGMGSETTPTYRGCSLQRILARQEVLHN
jgi:hypothetical protein